MSHTAKHGGSAMSCSDEVRTTFADYTLSVQDNGSDKFAGTAGMDISFGRGGRDVLLGSGADDDLQGGRGLDRLEGGDGCDHLDGGTGTDLLFGGGESDALRGGGGDAWDVLSEGDGHGDLEGEGGNDLLLGGRGGDAFVVDRDTGHDVIEDFQAGPGLLDHIAFRNVAPEELSFFDTIEGLRIGWNGDASSVLLVGVRKSDLAGDDLMFTDDRSAILPTSPDAERVSAETFAKDEGGALSAPNPGGESVATDAYVFDEFNIRIGGSGADIFQGTDDRDDSFGLAGDDRLYGAAGDDDLRGDEGNDILDGGEGQDHLKGGAGDDVLYGGAAADNAMGGEGRDTIYAGAGHDMIEGEGGDDVIDGGDGADAFIVQHGSGNDVVTGGFDAGPGAFDHIAFKDISPNEVEVTESASTHGDGHSGVLVSWGDGSIFLEGLTKSAMAQDDFMFDADLGTRGQFIDDPAIASVGSELIFGGDVAIASNPAADYVFG